MPVRALVLALALVLAGGGAAHADKVSKKFAGQVLLSSKRFPHSAKSVSGYIAALKKQKQTKFQENEETGEWKIYIAAFFKKPLTDLEYTIKFVDDQGHMVGTPFEQYTDASTSSSILSDVTLDKKTFGVNKRLTIVVQQNGKTIAQGKFQILGKVERGTGKVDFTNDDGSSDSDGSEASHN
jgi:hypothetical protein